MFNYALTIFSIALEIIIQTFSKEECQDYKDEERERLFIPLPGIKRPPPPKIPFPKSLLNFQRTDPSCEWQIATKSCEWQRQQSHEWQTQQSGSRLQRPHLRALQNVPCYHENCTQNWEDNLEVGGHTPGLGRSFYHTSVQVNILNKVSRFRPIALTSTIGKIFSLLSVNGCNSSWSRTVSCIV